MADNVLYLDTFPTIPALRQLGTV